MIRGERGLTLVELLIAAAVTGVLATVLGTAVYQLYTATEYGNGRFTSLHELQNAAYWFNLDGQEAVSAVGGTGLTLTLPTSQVITYTLSTTNLQRATGTSTLTLAQNISSVSFSVSGQLVTMNITSSPSGRMDTGEQAAYTVYLRPVTP
jgi:prepilin-type N-terminal cleavage/methylation domain-containing protein